jgi:very-short-patch-repair endonuclease
VRFAGSYRLVVNIRPDFRAFTSVKASSIDIQHILASNLVIAARDHPQLRGAIQWRVRTGELKVVLPGVYAPAATASSVATRMAAVGRWDPDAVLTHEGAAAASFWPGLAVPVVRCAVRHYRAPQPGFAFSRGQIPPELVWSRKGMRLASPAITALDLCETLGGGAIDRPGAHHRALRTRSTTLASMHAALNLTKGRAGNPRRQQLLLDSRDEPWSEAERQFHRLLRAAGITGWQANQAVRLGGVTVCPDVLFRRLRLVIEIDGREFHSDPEVFESDRRRQNLLVLNGWRVLRVTWQMIQTDPDQVIAMVREAITLSAVE